MFEHYRISQFRQKSSKKAHLQINDYADYLQVLVDPSCESLPQNKFPLYTINKALFDGGCFLIFFLILWKQFGAKLFDILSSAFHTWYPFNCTFLLDWQTSIKMCFRKMQCIEPVLHLKKNTLTCWKSFCIVLDTCNLTEWSNTTWNWFHKWGENLWRDLEPCHLNSCLKFPDICRCSILCWWIDLYCGGEVYSST